LKDSTSRRPGVAAALCGHGGKRRGVFPRTRGTAGRGFFHGTVLLIYFASFAGNVSAGLAQGTSEYEVKAAFLYNFAKFVEWPAPPSSGFALCVVGDDPFGDRLEKMVGGKTLNGLPIDVRRLRIGENPRRCQVAFIGAADHESRAVLETLRGANVLTVGDSPNFARDGGIINFILKDNKVYFEINVDAAEQAHLKISSKLLNLAKIIRN